MEKELNNNSTQGTDLVIMGHILAQRPNTYYLLALAQQLNADYHSGKLTIPNELDLTALDPQTAEIAAAFVAAVRG